MKYYKLVNKQKEHFGFKYQEGLNDDSANFDEITECDKGLHFTTYANVPFWLKTRDETYWIYEVIIPNDAIVCESFLKYKANKIIMTNPKYIGDFLEECHNFKDIIKNYPLFIRFIKNQTEELCISAVKKDYRAIKYISGPTLKICTAAYKKTEYARKYIPDEFLHMSIFN